jgi:regulator of sigma E protease
MTSGSIFDWIQLAAENTWLYGGTFLLVLGILVFVHEWGHYYFARLCGVKVESFSIGFGPELFGFTDKNETRWKFSLVPLGGYVKMFGDSDPSSARHDEEVEDSETHKIRPFTEEEKKVAFFTQAVWKRAIIVFAGPAVNFIFAIILYVGLFTVYGQPVTPSVSSGVIAGSAAEAAGIQPHDVIMAVDGTDIRSFEELRTDITIGLDAPRLLKIKRDGKIIEIEVTPERQILEDNFGFKHARGRLGVISPAQGVALSSILAVEGEEFETQQELLATLQSNIGNGPFKITLPGAPEPSEITVNPLKEKNEQLLSLTGEGLETASLILAKNETESFIKYNIVDGTVQAVYETYSVSVNTLEALWQIISGARSATELGGIIRIGAFAGDMAQAGLIALISFTALLSINLGLINLFPIPVLDGGHLVFYLIEVIKGSPISENVQEYAFRMGFVVLIALMLFTNLNDIVQLVK